MTVTNFKIGSGLDIQGNILDVQNGQLHFNNNPVGGGGTGTVDLADSGGLAFDSYGKLGVDIVGSSWMPYGGLKIDSYGLQIALGGWGNSGLYLDTYGLVVDTNTIATRAYVDSIAQGLDIKASVEVRIDGNVETDVYNYLNGASYPSKPNLGGGQQGVGSRVLIVNGPNSIAGIFNLADDGNGNYYFAISQDTNATGELTAGAFTFVEGGTDAGKSYVLTLNGWTQFGAGGGSSLTLNENNHPYDGLNYNYGSGLRLDSYGLQVKVGSWESQYGQSSGLKVDSYGLSIDLRDGINSGLTLDSYGLKVAISSMGDSGLMTDMYGLKLSPYGATIKSDGTLSATLNRQARQQVFATNVEYSSPNTISVAQMPWSWDSADIDVVVSVGQSTRASKIKAVQAAQTVTFTEYAIVSSDPNNVPGVSFGFEWDGSFVATVSDSNVNPNNMAQITANVSTIQNYNTW